MPCNYVELKWCKDCEKTITIEVISNFWHIFDMDSEIGSLNNVLPFLEGDFLIILLIIILIVLLYYFT